MNTYTVYAHRYKWRIYKMTITEVSWWERCAQKLTVWFWSGASKSSKRGKTTTEKSDPYSQLNYFISKPAVFADAFGQLKSSILAKTTLSALFFDKLLPWTRLAPTISGGAVTFAPCQASRRRSKNTYELNAECVCTLHEPLMSLKMG